MTKTIVALLAGMLAGCASLNNIDVDVSSFSRWPAGRTPSTYAFERLPSQQANPQNAQVLEDSARPAIEGAGFQPAAEGGVADVTVQLGARITEYDRSPFDDPFWYGGYPYWHRPFVYGRYGRPYWGPSWGPYWGPGWGYGTWGWGSFPIFQREVAVLMRDKRSGEPLFESRGLSEGTTSAVGTVLPVMFIAVMKDFPSGNPTNPHRITIEMAH